MPRSSVNGIRPLLERLHDAAERRVEHRAHQQCKTPAGKLVGKRESDLAAPGIAGQKIPTAVQSPHQTIRRGDQDAPVRPVQGDAATEGFTEYQVRDRHVGRQGHDIAARLARPDDLPLAEGNEFRIAFDVGDEIEHLIGAVRDQSVDQKIRHLSRTGDYCIWLRAIAFRNIVPKTMTPKYHPRIFSVRRSSITFLRGMMSGPLNWSGGLYLDPNMRLPPDIA
jgi:hypothetical protein